MPLRTRSARFGGGRASSGNFLRWRHGTHGTQAVETNPLEGVEFTDALSRIVDMMLHHEFPDNESVIDDFVGHEFRNFPDTLQVRIEQFSHKLVSDHIGPHSKLRHRSFFYGLQNLFLPSLIKAKSKAKRDQGF